MNKKIKQHMWIVLLILSVVLASACGPAETESPQSDRLMLIAHAGGAIDGIGGTNSLEALEGSAALGHRFIEVDFLLTTDDRVVLNHNWIYLTGRVPGAKNEPVSHREFMEYKLFHRFSPVDLEMLVAFLDRYPDIRIITDTKDAHYKALQVIATEFPAHIDRFIPQAYAFEDIPYIQAMGFEDIILTVYEMPRELAADSAEIARQLEPWVDVLFGVTIPEAFWDEVYAAHLDLAATRFFAHTINCQDRAYELQALGLYGIYTGTLFYDQAGALFPALDAQIDRQISQAQERLDTLMGEVVSLLPVARIYHLDAPFYFAYGEALPINDAQITNLFKRHGTGEVYLPVSHFATAMQGYEWYRWEEDTTALSLTIHIDAETSHHLETNETDGPLIFRRIPFIGQGTIEGIFPYQVMVQEPFVIVLPAGMAWDGEELYALGRGLFGVQEIN